MQQPAPELRPIGGCAKFEQAQPDDPIHVRRNQPAQHHHVGNAPGFALQIQHSKFARAFRRMIQTMIDAARKTCEPGSCLGGHCGEDLRDGAPDIERSDQTVEVEPEAPGHLADPSLREPTHQFHLSQPQMRMDDTQSGGEILIGLRFDERDLMIVPTNGHRPRYRRAFERQHGEPLLQRARRVRTRVL